MISDEYHIVQDVKAKSGMIWSTQCSGFVLLSKTLQSPFRFPDKQIALKAAQRYQKGHNIPLQIVQCFVVPRVIATVEAVPGAPLLPRGTK